MDKKIVNANNLTKFTISDKVFAFLSFEIGNIDYESYWLIVVLNLFVENFQIYTKENIIEFIVYPVNLETNQILGHGIIVKKFNFGHGRTQLSLPINLFKKYANKIALIIATRENASVTFYGPEWAGDQAPFLEIVYKKGNFENLPLVEIATKEREKINLLLITLLKKVDRIQGNTRKTWHDKIWGKIFLGLFISSLFFIIIYILKYFLLKNKILK